MVAAATIFEGGFFFTQSFWLCSYYLKKYDKLKFIEMECLTGIDTWEAIRWKAPTVANITIDGTTQLWSGFTDDSYSH